MKAVRLIFILFLLNVVIVQVYADAVAKAKCEQANTDCSACIGADPLCSWCSEWNNLTSQGLQQRCMLFSDQTCQKEFIVNPQNKVNVTKDVKFSNISSNANTANINAVQLRPQAVNITLRKNLQQKVNFTFRRVVDYPLDLYYVMDLSFSMEDDLTTLQNLGSSLFEEIRNLTKNVRLGFGTFVDKVMLPYVSTIPSQLKNPCLNTQNENCAPVFGFRHQLPITADGTAFIEAVRSTKVSGNIDSPEGGFDALMQIAVCENQIEWRDESLRVVLFSTDAAPHIAMDGKLAAILDINDMKCHLEKGVHPYYNSSYVYSMSKVQDYPSVGQLKKAFNEKKIQPVFAITKEVYPLYQKLGKLLEPAYVDELNNDSSNVVTLISRSYDEIRRKVQLNVPIVPNNIDLKYRVLCPGLDGWQENSLDCNNVSIGDEVVFQFELLSKDCPSGGATESVININSNSIQDTVSLRIGYICDCPCASNKDTNSSACSNQGDLVCGICQCNDAVRGAQCQCTKSTSNIPLEQNCTTKAYTNGDELCNNRGFCECGKCQCANSYGKYCECTNQGCAENSAGLCGGAEKGRCENCNNSPQCICNHGWAPDSSGACTCTNSTCRFNETSPLCSGNGRCECDRCVCDSNFRDALCDRCVHPQCLSIKGTCASNEINQCATCVYTADQSNKEIQSECTEACLNKGIRYKLVNALPDCTKCFDDPTQSICVTCNSISNDPSVHIAVDCESNPFTTCILRYKVAWDTEKKQYIVFVKEFVKADDCPEVDPLTIVLPVVGGILLIGIIALIIWKIIQTIRDKHEYERFLLDTKNPQWGGGGNNLVYVSPQERVTNPMFIGND